MVNTILNIANNYFGTAVFKNIIDEQTKFNFETKIIVFLKAKYCYNLRLPDNCLLLVENSVLNSFFRFFPKLRFIYHKKEILNFISDSEIKYVHSHTLHSNGCLGASICEHYSLPHIVSVRNTDINYSLKYMKHLHRTYLKILRSAKYITAPNLPYASLIEQRFSVNARMLPNPIDSYWENVIPSSTFKQENTTFLNVCSVGAINRNKNQLGVLRALEKLDAPCRLTLVGKIEDRAYFSEIKPVCSNSCVEVTHLDHLSLKSDLLGVLRNMDVMCLPSFKETFGLSYIECAMVGVPVVYSRGQAIDGILADGIIGYSANPRNLMEIKEAILKCDFLDRSDVSKTAKKQFGRSKYVESLGGLYD